MIKIGKASLVFQYIVGIHHQKRILLHDRLFSILADLFQPCFSQFYDDMILKKERHFTLLQFN